MKNFLQLKLDMEVGIDGMLANETKKISFYSKEVFNPEEGVKFAKKLIKEGNSVGILFGSERAGLNKKEISCSNAIISIPVSEKFKSINLSHAVGIISYEWFKNSKNNGAEKIDEINKFQYVKKIHVEKFVLKLKSQLQKNGYFWPDDKVDSLNLNIDNLFHGLELTKPNLKTLFGIWVYFLFHLEFL